ncbi:MAG TPA: hypothetical protein ENK66_10375 [Arcobacter sp.]|nr:hypothetical protein [Arcobacter sp.]
MKQYNDNEIGKLIKNDSIEIFDAIRFTSQDNYQQMIEKFCIKDKIDYFDLACQALNHDANSWNLGNILVDFIPYSKINIDNIFKLYELLYTKENATSVHYKITESLIKNNHILAKKLLEHLIGTNENFAIPHISAILVELHNTSEEHQYDTVVSFLKTNNLFKLKCVIGYIHLFDFSDEELENIFKMFQDKVTLSNEEIDRELLYNSYDLIEKGHEYFSEILLLYIDYNDINIKFHFSQVLHFSRKHHLHKEWFKKSFLSIIDIDIEQQNIIHNIEFILEEYLKNDEYSYMKKFLFKWAEKGNLSSISSKNTLSIFSREFNEHQLFNRFVTESLIYESNKLHEVLPNLVEKDIQLDVDTMKSFSFEDYLYVCRKILGYFHEFSIMNTMLFSILSVNNLSKEVKQLVLDILIHYIGKDYSSDTLEYLKSLDEAQLNKNEREVKNQVVKVLEKRNEQIQALPILKELTPPSQQNRLIARTNSIAMSEAMKESEKNSVFSSFFPTTPIRYGKGVFMFQEFNGGFSDVMYLQSHRHSITIPVSTRTHPINYELERYNFRRVKKGQ